LEQLDRNSKSMKEKHVALSPLCDRGSMHTCDEIFGLGGLEWGGKSLIHSIETVQYSFLKRFPPILVISADGWVATRAWSHPELRPVTAEESSRKGILELAFLFKRSGGVDEKSLQPIHADLELQDRPETILKITVRSATNQITRLVGQARLE
jgi:hypothetical protein